MKKTDLKNLTECSIMIALATVLSLFKLVDYPAGGSVTLASMLPIAAIAYRHGLKWGISAATVTGVLQMLLGLSAFAISRLASVRCAGRHDRGLPFTVCVDVRLLIFFFKIRTFRKVRKHLYQGVERTARESENCRDAYDRRKQ